MVFGLLKYDGIREDLLIKKAAADSDAAFLNLSHFRKLFLKSWQSYHIAQIQG